MVQVSVLVVTYNPDPEKLLKTLRAVTGQKDIDFEIIISDDGSPKENHFDLAERYFSQIGFTNYRLVANPVNKGTVQNCISAIEAATGEYVFSTSPGDILFDDHTLADFYRYAKENHLTLCFGNPVHYNYQDGKAVLVRQYSTLVKPQLYRKGKPLPMIRTCFMHGNFVVGATFFQERIATMRWWKACSETAVFTEDSTSTAYALAEGVPLTHYDRNMVWYEDGSGISTGGSSVWTQRITKDWQETVFRLHEIYPKDAYIDLAYMSITMPAGKKRTICKFLKHPFAMLCGKLNELSTKPQPIRCTQEDLRRLEEL